MLRPPLLPYLGDEGLGRGITVVVRIGAVEVVITLTADAWNNVTFLALDIDIEGFSNLPIVQRI